MDESPRFRRALKNPLAVIGLCLIAGFAMYSNMMDRTSEEPDIISAGLDRLLSNSTPPPVTPTHRTHEKESTQWIDHPDRDPFSPVPIDTQSFTVSPSTSVPLHTRDPQLQNGLILKAIAIEGPRRSAVINRSVVYEGEMIEGYQILSIQPTGILLKHQGRTRLLTFSEIPTS